MTTLTLDAVGEKAEAMYEANLRAHVETEDNIGKLLLLDTETGRHVIGTSRIDLARQLNAQRPEAVCTFRIGYPAVSSLGGALRPYSQMSAEEIAAIPSRIRSSGSKI